jgi:hypothetical protein
MECAQAHFMAMADSSNLMKIRFDFVQKALGIANNSFSAV